MIWYATILYSVLSGCMNRRSHLLTALSLRLSFFSIHSATTAVYLVEAAAAARADYAGIVHSFYSDGSTIYTINNSTLVAPCRRQLRTGCVPTHFCTGIWLPAAVPNVAMLDEQPEDQAAQQPPPDWTLPGDSVVLPEADHLEQGNGDRPPPPPPRPAEHWHKPCN